MDKLIHYVNTNKKDFAMFETMVEAIEEDVAKYIMKAEIRQ